jgi:endonuclease/exonuclease/phosphatase family metal-dependent hydrolase
MIRRLISVVALGSVFAAVGCASTGETADENASSAANEVNAAPECNPIKERATLDVGDIEGLSEMPGTPLPSRGPDAEGYFHPAAGYTEGGTFAQPSDGAGNKWKVDAKDIAAPAPAGKLRIVEWNVERGNQLDKSIRLMKKINADVWLLNETDLYGTNSGGVVVGREIARALGYSYYTGIEFYERLAERRGTSGNSIISRYPLTNTRSLDIPIMAEDGGHDWSTDEAEPRCGSRTALGASIEVTGASGAKQTVNLVGLHTENKSNKKVRLAQFDYVVKTLVKPGEPTIVAGDLNTVSPFEGGAMRDEIKKDGQFFDCSRGDDRTTFSAAVIVNLRIDWMLLQGAGVLDCPVNSYDVRGNDGSSDHKPVVTEMTVK